MKNRLKRRYGNGDLHFITCSCYQRRPLLGTPKARDRFLQILSAVRDRYDFGLIGYVVMPEHIHLLISEPNVGNPSSVMKALKQRVSHTLRGEKLGRSEQFSNFWQTRFYDFNVWSKRKRNEKLNYIHFNPVRRGLVETPKDWAWSSYAFYWHRERGICDPNPEWVPKEVQTGMKPEPTPYNTHSLQKPQRMRHPSSSV